MRFRWSRAVPAGVKSYRVTMDRAGRWHVAFAAIPAPVPAPGNGQVVGIDRGVTVCAALSTGELLHAPGLTARERAGCGGWSASSPVPSAARTAARGSSWPWPGCGPARRTGARTGPRRSATDLARRFDLIRVEDLQIPSMTRSAGGRWGNPAGTSGPKAGLNREILASGWGLLVRRLAEKAPGRVEKISPAFTSQRCSACGHVDAKSRRAKRASRARPAVSPATLM